MIEMIGWIIYIVGYIICAIESKELAGSLLWPFMLCVVLLSRPFGLMRDTIGGIVNLLPWS